MLVNYEYRTSNFKFKYFGGDIIFYENEKYVKNIRVKELSTKEKFIEKCNFFLNYGIKEIIFSYDNELKIGKCKIINYLNNSCTNWIENIAPDEDGYFNEKDEKELLFNNSFYLKSKEV